MTSSQRWENHGYEIQRRITGREKDAGGRSPLSRQVSFAKRAAVQWYKMKWQLTGKADNTWGDELQGFAVVKEASPLGDAGLEFFEPGKVNQCRLKFFNMSRGDDASDDFRCAFLKFGDDETAGPFDLPFTTGRVSCYSTVEGLQDFCGALDGDEDAMRDWALKSPENYFALVDGLRRFPQCRTELDYYNHVTYRVEINGGRKLVRFRLHGGNDVIRRLATQQEQEEAWIIRRPDMELPADTYLTDRLLNVASENKTMKLQIQIREYDPPIGDPAQFWDEEAFPWRDLADLTLTYLVPKLLEERANYDFRTLPGGISVEIPQGGENYGSLVLIQEKVMTSTVRPKHPEGARNESKKTTTFLVHVETGDHLFSGTDAGVYIALYGTKGRTKRYLLDKLFHNDFERGSKESYYVDVPFIGDVIFVQVFLIGGTFTFARRWFLSNIVLFDLSTRRLLEIPCNSWINFKITLPTGEAMLAKDEKHFPRKLLRHIHLEESQRALKWAKTQPGYPGQIDCANYSMLPVDLQYNQERQLEKKKIILDVVLKLKLQKYTTMLSSCDSLAHFKTMASVVPQTKTMKAILENDKWRTDEEFGREVLDGVNPIMIRRCSKPLEEFPVTNEMVGNLLDRGLNLEEEMKAGHVYFIHYKHLSGVERRGGDQPRYVATPYLMLFVKSTGQLVPIAIQLEEVPGPGNPIWTPNDDPLGWLLAKTYVKSADSHYQTICGHLLQGHLFMEVFTLAILRQFPRSHPLYKLLVQYTRYTVASAQMGRDLLIHGEESVFQKILSIPGKEPDFMRNYFADFTIRQLIPVHDFKDRGVDDPNLLPNYHYRDDACSLWNKIVEKVNKILKIFYETNKDVASDKELQYFVKDLRENGFNKGNGKSNGIPTAIETLEELVEFVAMIIFHSSAFHSALNFSQSDYFSFGPNYPSAMRRAPPSDKGPITEKDIVDTLPSQAEQAVAIAFSHYLSEPLSDEVYLGEFKDSYFTETSVREILDWYADEMGEISRQIYKRNEQLDVPYEYLLPEKIPKAAGQ